MSSLFERIGGEAALLAAVRRFYDRVLADPVVRPYFAELDMEAQTRKQVAFMSRALGGPSEYHGRDLRSAHAELVSRGLSDLHFDAVVGHLRETLAELGVDPVAAATVVETIERTRGEVLGR